MKSILKLVLVSFIATSFNVHANSVVADVDINAQKQAVSQAVMSNSYECKRIYGFANQFRVALRSTMIELTRNTTEVSVVSEEGYNLIQFRGEDNKSRVVYTVVASLDSTKVKSILTQKYKKVEGDVNWDYLTNESICSVK